MGPAFEGREITKKSLLMAQFYVQSNARPAGGECFEDWAKHWHDWLRDLKHGFAAVGVVTHNRNIQYLYSLYGCEFHYKLYNCIGPDYCTVHVYNRGRGEIESWGNKNTPRGIYLIRHGETDFGT